MTPAFWFFFLNIILVAGERALQPNSLRQRDTVKQLNDMLLLQLGTGNSQRSVSEPYIIGWRVCEFDRLWEEIYMFLFSLNTFRMLEMTLQDFPKSHDITEKVIHGRQLNKYLSEFRIHVHHWWHNCRSNQYNNGG